MASRTQLLPLAEKVKALIKNDSRGSINGENYHIVPDDEGDDSTVGVLGGMDIHLHFANEHFHDMVMALVKALVETDMIESTYISTEDMTDSYISATSRNETQDVTRKARTLLLSKADKVDGVLRIVTELNQGSSGQHLRAVYTSYNRMTLDEIMSKLDYSDLSVSVRKKPAIKSQATASKNEVCCQ